MWTTTDEPQSYAMIKVVAIVAMVTIMLLFDRRHTTVQMMMEKETRPPFKCVIYTKSKICIVFIFTSKKSSPYEKKNLFLDFVAKSWIKWFGPFFLFFFLSHLDYSLNDDNTSQR